MFRNKALVFTLATVSLVALAGAILTACNGLGALPGLNLPGLGQNPGNQQPQVSPGRLNAARAIAAGSTLWFDLLQRDTTNAFQHPCDPIGVDPNGLGNIPWTTKFGPIILTPTFLTSEYDWLASLGETDYCVALRVPVEPNYPLFFTQLEISLRAVNPFVTGHLPGQHFDAFEAIYPSNDDVLANRSLFDVGPFAGDVALVVRGVNFAGPALLQSTAYMNGLGPTAWLVFLRDNAFQSGRFYNIVGALKGAPRALSDTPTPLDDGFFMSVQVNGDNFDLNSEPFGNYDFDDYQVCIGGPTRPYAFLDFSNVDDFGAPSPGEGGFIFVMRAGAFRPGGALAGVVVDPNAPFPMPVNAGNQIIAPVSGYNEPLVPPIAGPDEDNFATPPAAGQPQGVHELGISVFFVHQS